MCRGEKYNMRLRREFYTSYKTHTYCAKEEKWILRTDWKGSHCPTCGVKLRQKTKFSSKDKYVGAY